LIKTDNRDFYIVTKNFLLEINAVFKFGERKRLFSKNKKGVV